MYTLIYQYIYDYLFNDTNLQSFNAEILGQNTNMAQWLSHSLTIVSMILLFVFGILILKWVFRLVGGLFLLK